MNNPVRILLLEDDPADARLVMDTLREENFDAAITIAANRERYIEALDRNDFDLVLADYRLPGFDGLQAMALWRERHQDRPFLFVTGSMGEELAVESLKSGATDYILKQTLARLVPAIRRAVAESDEVAKRRKAEQTLIAINTELVREVAERKKTEDEARQIAAELHKSNEELKLFNKAMVGRELRMVELKKEVNKLHKTLGSAAPYP